MAHVLVSPLNWGLGHATRDIPVIRTLLAHGHEVTVAACGSALAVLRQEFPDCRCIEFADYPAAYSSGRWFLPKFCANFPLMLRAIGRERAMLETILARDRYDLIISDNRLGVYSPNVPSIFITHQLHYHLPLAVWPLELAAVSVNCYLHEKFNRIIVPDNPAGAVPLAGKLSRPETDVARERVFFAGILSSARKQDRPEDLDYLIIVSGPEPQRTCLEQIVLPQLGDLGGNGVVLLGSPQRPFEESESCGCSIISYVPTEEKVALMDRARCVICRSGYTTMMELAELGKRCALLVPTPGQPEQEYLSWYYERQGWFWSRDQYHLDLARDIPKTCRYTGFPAVSKTAENVRQLYTGLLAGYLE
jgi:UDP:flavonoid glycosyltransferase YjiC (YdhE family)